MKTSLNVPAQLCPLICEEKKKKKGDQKSPLVNVLAIQNTTNAKSQMPVGEEGIHLPVL